MKQDKRITRISILWIIVMVGLIYHTVLHLAPIFYGIDIVKANATGVMPKSMVLTFGLSFLIPVLAILSVNYLRNKIGWILNLCLATIALLVNTGHMTEFIVAKHFDPTQTFVLIPVFITSLLLTLDAWHLKSDRL